MFVPAPVVIVSLPTPPMTIASPPVVEMTSSPPCSGSIVVTMPMVIGSVPKRFVSAAAA